MEIAEKLSRKGADVAAIAAEVLDRPEVVEELVAGVMAPKGTLRYGFEKVLRKVSEERPELVYPYFDRYVELLDSPNSFLKWGAILTIANLAPVDTEGRFEKIFKKYYAPVRGPVMVTAANAIGASVKIIQAKPELARRIRRILLEIEQAEFEKHGEPSPECRNVAIGQTIDAFDQVFDRIDDRGAVVSFVRRQLDNTRPAVVKKARAFLARHADTV